MSPITGDPPFIYGPAPHYGVSWTQPLPVGWQCPACRRVWNPAFQGPCTCHEVHFYKVTYATSESKTTEGEDDD
jgi:hypothetical protein